MTYNLWKIDTAGVTVTASTTYDKNIPSNLIDGNLSTVWGSSSGAPQWILFDFGSNKTATINGYEIFGANPVTWKLFGSNDNTTFRFLHSYPASLPISSTEVSKLFTFYNNTPYRYYKFTDVNRDNSNWMTIAEIKFLDTKSSRWRILSSPLTKDLFNGNSINIQEVSRTIQVISREMKSDKNFSNGKTFSYELDLNKYIDIKNLSIS